MRGAALNRVFDVWEDATPLIRTSGTFSLKGRREAVAADDLWRRTDIHPTSFRKRGRISLA